MANAAANEGQGAARVGRLVTRTLFVLGGALAGTAVAWLVSDASASADTVVGTSSVTPLADATVGGLDDAAHGVSEVSGDLAGGSTCEQDVTSWSNPAAQGEPHPVCAAIARGHVGGPARQAVGTLSTSRSEHEASDRVSDALGDLTGDTVFNPVQRTLDAFEHIARKPEDTRQVLDQAFTPTPEAREVGRQVWQLLDPAGHGDLVPLPVLPGLAPVEQDPVTGGAGRTTESVETATAELPATLRAALAMPGYGQQTGFAGDQGQSRNGHRDLPAPLNPAQLPIAPSVPTAPGGGTAPGGHLDGLNYGVPFWVSAAVENAVAGANRAGRAHTPRTPGSQPGVTPD